MLPDPSPIARLRRVVAALEDGHAPGPEDAAWMVAATRRYEAARTAGLDLQLDRALSLAAPNRHGWWRAETLAERDRLFHTVRERHGAGLSDARAAEVILPRLARLAPRRGREAEADDWAALRAAVVRSGRALPAAKRLTRVLAAGRMTPGS